METEGKTEIEENWTKGSTISGIQSPRNPVGRRRPTSTGKIPSDHTFPTRIPNNFLPRMQQRRFLETEVIQNHAGESLDILLADALRRSMWAARMFSRPAHAAAVAPRAKSSADIFLSDAEKNESRD